MESVSPVGESDRKLSLVIFAARESLGTCIRTLNAAHDALPPHGTIDVLVNGNPNLARSLSEILAGYKALPTTLCVRVWNLPLGDKANAWNAYFHNVWDGEKLVFFIDGYVRLLPNALRNLMKAVDSRPSSLGGSGVPTVGRTSAALRTAMLVHGGFHGNLCCVKGDVIEDLRRRRIRIPLGVYRVDSILGAVLSFGLNPRDMAWDPLRVVVCPDASWNIDEKSVWRWRDWRAKLNQVERQLRGEMENAAVKFFFTELKVQPEELPKDVRQLSLAWRKLGKDSYQKFTSHNLLSAFAYWRHLQQTSDWTMKDVCQLVVQTPFSKTGPF
ncbi:hypothetical protein [Hydrogenophaga sp.]|uniref:hypothetical protein n=1 Tax=Hydrogenophaga sp. TaxID=1904254 RepID=UPI002731C5C1|nr:hypothetical protein [Hydrogenophaga sp.]MDP1684473.1 hypothetical protein [Hydrogenophaga sp.]